ncbi:helix-turn-helix domain-containing protein [Paenibacillus doosanensis]|uniref:HTH-type transcriptional regulator YesS n=1 Tax=Paenibacillus konkukensis TaxID=2020716 RepID=A0ABY4RW08_9BACL|nr:MULTISPECIES: helix-turn-helix domain-containing protein [Paenibacillus]MCS7460773.1 helix-turn-helix domain-containing protein [Paenibacillus doosanensis]UQZ85954.1 HTH-type transcriptional regulator YesS [Paenibacillus konkukensis]
MSGIVKPWLEMIRKYKYNSRFFRKILVLILLIASIPGLIIGVSIYGIATNNLEEALQRQHQNQIRNRAANLDEQLAYLEMTLSHWAFDPKFDDNLKHISFSYQFEQVQELYRTLLVMEGAHPLLEKVQLYLDAPRPLTMTKDGYAYLSDAAKIESYDSFLANNKSMFWTNDIPGEAADTISLVTKIPGGSSQPFGVIIATVNKEKLNQVLKTLNPYEEGVTLLMTGDGSWHLSTNGNTLSKMEQSLLQEYDKHSATTDSFLYEYDQTTYSVSYGQISRLGTKWIYVSAAPLTSITAPVIAVSKWILIVSLTGLMLALLLSWFVSRRISLPVERLVGLLTGDKTVEVSDEFDLIEKQWKHLSKESETLKHKLQEQLPALQEGFFLQLAQGYLLSLQEKDIQERMKYYGWETEDRKFVALMFQLTGFSNLEGRFLHGDEDLVTFAAANIISELTKKQYEQVEVINFHNFSIGVLLSLPGEHPSSWLEDDLDALCAELMHTINQILNMQVTIAVSRWIYNVKQIPHLFEEAKQALAYRDLLGEDNQIIRTERTLRSNLSEASNYYPFTLDKDIVAAIRNGQETDAVDLIKQFMDELSTGGSTEFVIQQGMLQLLGSIRYAAMQSGMNPVQLFGSVNLFDQLAQIKEPDEMLRWFQRKVIGVFVQEMISRQNIHLKQIVDKVVVYLRENYMNALSLESCADLFGTSPYTLSRAFKQINGVNFIDYLTNIRIQNAKALLKETEMKINEVAESVGYQHSYFNRIFKKYEGITPSQFRELNR